MLRRSPLIIVSPNQKRPMPVPSFLDLASRHSDDPGRVAGYHQLHRPRVCAGPDHGCLVPGRPEGHIQGLLMRGKMVYAVHIYQVR